MTAARPDAPVRVFLGTSLALALTAGFGLGLWLLLDATLGVPLLGMPWLALVQAHGHVQLFGFAALFILGIAYGAFPRFRATEAPPRPPVLATFALLVAGVALRAVAQPFPGLPARGPLLLLSAALEVGAAATYAAVAFRLLRSGRNPHRVDERVVEVGALWFVAAALLDVLAVTGPAGGALVVDQRLDEAVIAAMLYGFVADHVFGVTARVAPAFMAARPMRPPRFVAAAVAWNVAVAGIAAGVGGAWALALAAAVAMIWTLGLFGGGVAALPLHPHARATRFAMRSAYVWLAVAALLAAVFVVRGALGAGAPSLTETSAARHAAALGFVTLIVYGVAARLVPAVARSRPWNVDLVDVTLVLGNLGVALRVLPELFFGHGEGLTAALIALSGIVSYAALVLFVANVARGLRTASPARMLE